MSDPAASPNQPAYQVVARRYRPQRFADLVGQEHVARGLSGAIETGRIGHAYLFTGARGVGKTSAARIYAKALNCETGPAPEPCNACDACTAITAGQDVDVVEIDAASNRGIDEIRSLRQNVAVRPARGRFKVYIIDEVHMLTREAFNALLKTLEEPPGHVKFVFCTTEPEKLPITILSRCQRFDFLTVDAPAIARRLAQIVEAEGAEVTAEALQLIARRAAGSMRDSQSLLEQLLGAATAAVGVDDVHAVIGTGSEERIGELLTAITGRNAAAAVAALDQALAGGADPGGVLEQLLAALRDCLLASVGCDEAMLAGSAGLGVDVAGIGGELGTATVLAMLQILDQALSRMRTSGHAAVLAEMAVVRLASLEDLEGLAAAVDRVAAAGSAAGGGVVATAPAARRGGPPEKKTTDLTPAAARAAAGRAAVSVSQPARAPKETPSRPDQRSGPGLRVPDDQASGSDDAERQPTIEAATAWRAAGESLGGLGEDLAAAASGVAWRDGVLEVTFPADATTAAAFLKRPDSMAAIAAALTSAAGRTVRHAIVMDTAAPSSAPTPKPAVPSQAGLVRAATDHPLVGHARTLFDAAIRKVEPPRAREAEPAAGATVTVPAAGGSAGVAEDGESHG